MQAKKQRRRNKGKAERGIIRTTTRTRTWKYEGSGRTHETRNEEDKTKKHKGGEKNTYNNGNHMKGKT